MFDCNFNKQITLPTTIIIWTLEMYNLFCCHIYQLLKTQYEKCYPISLAFQIDSSRDLTRTTGFQYGSWQPCLNWHFSYLCLGNGLYLVLYDEEIEYIETFDTDDLGIKFLPHSPEEPPFLKELGFGFAQSYHYLIGLKERKVSGNAVM